MYVLCFRYKYAIRRVKSVFSFSLCVEVMLMDSCLLQGYAYVLRDI